MGENHQNILRIMQRSDCSELIPRAGSGSGKKCKKDCVIKKVGALENQVKKGRGTGKTKTFIRVKQQKCADSILYAVG